MKRNYVREPLGEMKTVYEAYNEAMVELAKKNSRIVIVYGDFARGSVAELFQRDYPDRIYDFGIAEANVITAAAGLAGGGKMPFTHCHTIFTVGRAYNQIRQNIAFDKLNVKIVLCATSGILVPFMGGSHQCIEDIAALRVIPNLVLVSPADPVETRKVTRAVAEYVGPVAIRLSNPPVPTIYKEEYPFELGKAVTVVDGEDATIIATGVMLADSLEATDILASEGIKVRLLDMHTIKPIDERLSSVPPKRPAPLLPWKTAALLAGWAARWPKWLSRITQFR